MSDEPVLLEEMRGPALWLTMNRPSALNSVVPETFAAFDAALERAERDPEIRAVVVTGAGRAFCAGADLKAILENRAGEDEGTMMARFFATANRVFNRLERLPKPTIAAVNGLALAAGIELLLCCDLVFADERARIGDGHANFGLLPGAGGSVRLPRRVGPGRAKRLLFTGDLLPAPELVSWGLVDEIAPADGLAAAVEAFVAKLVPKSPLGLARMKALVADACDQPLDTALRAEIAISELHVHSHDRNEGLAAFNEKRAPRFLGR
ncbi:MAG: enoyl-CoA hydratase/isomerase family protein [Gammaproteobacteria bacterium]|nr:enoyl-CoA hydratase/isomerase family protein [Gammaproteobacteria bacterium]MBI5617586.1 enoyl-CoA hydratase/isomerase family protein [Gammaproteobacteria bacterium]